MKDCNLAHTPMDYGIKLSKAVSEKRLMLQGT